MIFRCAAATGLFLSVISGMCPVGAAEAPLPQPAAVIGIYAGPSYARIDFREHDVVSSSGVTSALAGLVILLPRNRHSSLQTGLTIRTNGADYAYGPGAMAPEYGPRFRSSTNMTYVVLPVAVRVSPSSHTSGPYVTVGVDVAGLLSYHERRRDLQTNTVHSVDGNSAYNWELGALFGLGTALRFGGHRVFGELTLHRAISPVWPSTWGYSLGGNNQALGLAVGVWLR